MKKQVCAVLAALALTAGSLSACSGWQMELREPESESESKSASAGEEASEESKGESVSEEELIQEIILNFGAEWTEDGSGAAVMEPQAVSLYYYPDDLLMENMTAGEYFSWYHGYVRSQWDETIPWEEYVKKYESPYGEDRGYFYPQEEYEASVMKYFDVTVETLRSDPQFYHEEGKGYWVDGGGGLGDTPVITVTGYQRDEDTIAIGLTLTNESEGEMPRVLAVRLTDDGYRYWYYISGYLPDQSADSLDGEEFRQKALAMGYTQEYLDFIGQYRPGLAPDELLNDSETPPSLQTEFERERSVIDGWLALSPQQLAQQANRIGAVSRDRGKSVYLFFDNEAYYSPCYLIWNNGQESRLLSCFSEHMAQNEDDDILLVYDHTTQKAFDLNTGEEVPGGVLQFDYGREAGGSRERVILGLGYDAAAKYYVAGYADWLAQTDNWWEVKLAVFSRDGKEVRRFATGLTVPVSSKNFFVFADKVSFPQAGNVLMRFYDYGTVSCDYLTAPDSPKPLDEAALLALWDTLEGKWDCGDRQAAFWTQDGAAVMEIDGESGEVSDAFQLSDTVWKISFSGRAYYIDTGAPRDNKISMHQGGSQVYSEYAYQGK
ncbi:MAG: hypothetical protein PHD67_04850 [Oscillospiraceae bacterium]|nr:hypothetical protein [Oscillospiraceae bacterium]